MKITETKHSVAGFTLIELMITVVIIAIIAGIAYPNFVKFITESRRSDATTNLLRIAALQERFHTSCTPVKYAAAFGGTTYDCAGAGTLPANLAPGNLTKDGHYVITVAPCVGGALTSCFLLTATPVGSQATNDLARCASFSLDNIGNKTATGSEGASCWKK